MKNTKSMFTIIIPITVIGIFFLQIEKRNHNLNELRQIEAYKEKANSKYVKLLDQFPVYRDSIYSIYIANFDRKHKIVYLQKDSISNVQKGSKFFLHIYPHDQTLLLKTSFLPFDFKGYFEKFTFNETDYFLASTDLPKFDINKINTGQYGFEGDNNINWKIDGLLTAEKIDKTLKENKEVNVYFKKKN